jgi:hypothetical protein
MEPKQRRVIEKGIWNLRELQLKKETLLAALTDRLDKDAFGKNWEEYFKPLLEDEPDMTLTNVKKLKDGRCKRWLVDPSNSFHIVFYYNQKDGKIDTCFAEEYNEEWDHIAD